MGAMTAELKEDAPAITAADAFAKWVASRGPFAGLDAVQAQGGSGAAPATGRAGARVGDGASSTGRHHGRGGQ